MQWPLQRAATRAVRPAGIRLRRRVVGRLGINRPITLDVMPGPLNITARAWDDTGMIEPESPASLWNPRGEGNNAYARVPPHVA
jgi:hypothetical protein